MSNWVGIPNYVFLRGKTATCKHFYEPGAVRQVNIGRRPSLIVAWPNGSTTAFSLRKSGRWIEAGARDGETFALTFHAEGTGGGA